MIVVSNASPLILLAKLGEFDLLRRLFQEVFVATEVWDEVVVQGAGRPGEAEMQQAIWIRPVPLTNHAQLALWQTQYQLGAGELATILLAGELAATVALLDERRARRLAQMQGVSVLGVVGLLQLGFRTGEVADLRQSYQTLLASLTRLCWQWARALTNALLTAVCLNVTCFLYKTMLTLKQAKQQINDHPR